MSAKIEQTKPNTNKKVLSNKDSLPKTKSFSTYKAIVKIPLLNVRESGDFSAPIITTISKDTVVNIYEEINGWGKISKTADEWVKLTYVQKK